MDTFGVTRMISKVLKGTGARAKSGYTVDAQRGFFGAVEIHGDIDAGIAALEAAGHTVRVVIVGYSTSGHAHRQVFIPIQGPNRK